MKIYLFGEKEVVAHPYQKPFAAGGQCRIGMERNEEGIVFTITGTQSQQTRYELKHGELPAP